MNAKNSIPFILASASPRRQELLSMIGLPFTFIKPKIDESIHDDMNCEENVIRLAKEKTKAVSAQISYPAVIISADTLVSIDGRILGKPSDVHEAKSMITTLSGKYHTVLTGLCIQNTANQKILAGCSTTKVYFKKLSDHTIDSYLQLHDSLEFAGAYAIQRMASIFIERIEGDYFTVVGLPLSLLYDYMNQIGFDLLTKKWN